MEKIQRGDIVQYENNGEYCYGEVVGIYKNMVTVMDKQTEIKKRIPKENIRTMEQIIYLSREQTKQIFCFERNYSDVVEEMPPVDIYFDTESVFTFQDMITALENIRKTRKGNRTVWEEWLLPIFGWYDDDFEMEEMPEEVETMRFLPVRSHKLFMLAEEIDEILTSTKCLADCVDGLIEEIENYLEEEKKPVEERNYTDKDKKYFISQLRQDDIMKTATEKELTVYRKFVDDLCKKDSVVALECKGYGCYGGNRAYECDWSTALQCVRKLYVLTKEPKYANTLGYIYYYGRCWQGKPKYEEAFRYFTIGAMGEYYESQYKLADMFVNGYYVLKNKVVACQIVQRLYNENLSYMLEGKFDCKFADIAFRMGEYLEKGYTEYINHYPLAYRCYLQADFAIRQRLAYDYYGDVSVAGNIREALQRVLQSGKVDEPVQTAEIDIESLLHHYLEKYRKLQVDIRPLKNDVCKLTFRIAPFRHETYPPKMFVTVEKTGFCGMLEQVVVKVKNAEISEDISRTVYFDRIEDGEYYLGDEKVLEIQGRYYFTAPVKANAKKYRIASVCFVTGGKRYDYILEEDNVRVGDKVIVIANDEEKEVTVMDIREKTEAELVLPLKKYKKIQRKSS